MSSFRVPRLALNRLPRIPSQKVLVLDSVRAERQRLLILTLLALLASAATLALAVHAARQTYTSAAGHVLVIDAGSSGTRMYAYSWRQATSGGAPRLEAVPSTAAPHKVPRRALPDKRAYQRVETEPGLDAFADDAAGLQAKALGPLLEWAAAVVPRSQRPRTPVFLFGTAGLRKLSEEQQARLLDGCRAVLGASFFRFDPSWVRIISGTDEGVYGWIALNYLADTLQGGGSSGGTVGALDLGGSSLEVTFAAEAVPWKEDAVNATVLDATHQLYAHVHHHYGLNDAFDRAVTLLLAHQQTGGSDAQQQQAGDGGAGGAAAAGAKPQEGRAAAEQSAEVAAATGVGAAAEAATEEVAGRQDVAVGARREMLQAPAALRRQLRLSGDAAILGSGHSMQQVLPMGRRLLEGPPEVEHPCLHSGYRKAYRRRQQEGAAVPDPPEVMLVGRPSYEACKQLAAAVVAADAPCSAPPCALGTPQPSTSGHRFVALTGFFVVYKFFRLPETAGVAALERAGEEFCGKTWAQVQADRPGELMLEDYCFRAPYIARLLRHGLLLQDEQLRIGSGDMGWTLGAALAEGYQLGGLGQGSSGSSSWGAYALWLLLGATASAWLLYLAATGWQQQLQRPPGSSRLGATLGLSGLGLWASLGRASWLPQPLRGLGSRLPFKGSGPNLIELSIDSGPPSTDRSSLSMSSSLATSRTLADLPAHDLPPSVPGQKKHADAMEVAFCSSQGAEMAAWDIWAGVSLSLLLALALPGTLTQQRWHLSALSFALEVILLATPALLASLAPSYYRPRRTLILASCRLAAAALPRHSAPLRLPPSALQEGSWGGWLQFLLFTGSLGVNTLPWLCRLPFRWFMLVHAASLLDVSRAALPDVCASPAFSGPAARARFASLAHWAGLLSQAAPVPGQPSGGGSCLERLAAVAGNSSAGGLVGPAAAALGDCACRQAGVWVLLCVGFALPVAAQFLLETAARRIFLLRHCRQPRCDTCGPSKCADVPMLGATAALLLACFSAVAWQLVALAFPAP
ncbi:putative apyrase 7 [Chlorella sorokiniana]|uniref:Apyrase 7 n=1 Tax=Chlorella sorokiniana TaxID=3076 RepID=A0A2P6TEG9_CHLSO|nr:putative apyrase 7 [Chlorella sorokiniana]|eukprot:PRW21038.1 putative apyrase 7 [Chlorella sorokiniana]